MAFMSTSYAAFARRKSDIEVFMSGVDCDMPIRNPTPSAMIAIIARNRPKLFLNSFTIFLVNFFI